MTPEDEDVRLIQGGVRKALVGVGQAGGLDDEILVLGELRRQGLAEELVPVTLRLLRLLFVPDQHANRLRIGRQGKEGEQGDDEAHG